jgi:hypothetical protein
MKAVSNADLSTDGMNFIAEARGQPGRPADPPRISSASFGLRAAVLAGAVIVATLPLSPASAHARTRAVASTVMLGAPLSGLAPGAETTCCMPQ